MCSRSQLWKPAVLLLFYQNIFQVWWYFTCLLIEKEKRSRLRFLVVCHWMERWDATRIHRIPFFTSMHHLSEQKVSHVGQTTTLVFCVALFLFISSSPGLVLSHSDTTNLGHLAQIWSLRRKRIIPPHREDLFVVTISLFSLTTLAAGRLLNSRSIIPHPSHYYSVRAVSQSERLTIGVIYKLTP